MQQKQFSPDSGDIGGLPGTNPVGGILGEAAVTSNLLSVSTTYQGKISNEPLSQSELHELQVYTGLTAVLSGALNAAKVLDNHITKDNIINLNDKLSLILDRISGVLKS